MPCAMNAVELRRIDPARNMCRFYRLDIQPDLFGRVLLMKQWGRVGTQGRMMIESFESEALATAALQRHADRKRRRGYCLAFPSIPTPRRGFTLAFDTAKLTFRFPVNSRAASDRVCG
jgi:predicted DNA-binding WGR domain protein